MPVPEPTTPPRTLSTVDTLAQALNAFRREFKDSLSEAPDQSIDEAKKLVAAANKLIGTSGLGPALAPTLVEEVMHWDAWSKRPDFMTWVHFPVSDVTAESEKRDKNTVRTTGFTYNGCRYGVVFIDEGYNSFVPDCDSYDGKAEFLADDVVVLGLNLSKKMGGDYEHWRWTNVFSFTPGDWMKGLIEISTIIEKQRSEGFQKFLADDALSRARNIKL